jgi:hypothetical protein
MSVDLFQALASFTSSGRGSPVGCEVSLAFPFVMLHQVQNLAPPFTVELFVKMATADIPSAATDELAILAGVFPEWYISLRKVSSNSVKVGFYHAEVTLTSQGRQDSLVESGAIDWSTTWHHLAVVVTAKTGTVNSKNIHFFCNGAKVHSAYRSLTSVAPPSVHPDQKGAFHIGPPNIRLHEAVLAEGRGEPYFNVAHLFYNAEIDEVRVHNTSLDSLAHGFYQTELSRREACDGRFERLDGTCGHAASLTAHSSSEDRTSCTTGYELCASRPGMCIASCRAGMLRQPDCTCDCKSGQFQVWLVKAVYLRGSGTLKKYTVYDSQHAIVSEGTDFRLNQRIDLGSTTKVAVIVVRGGSSAIEVSLEVETATGRTMAVPEYQNIKLPQDRDAILHHTRVHEFSDLSFECVACPGESIGSTLPRMNALSCSCASGHDGRDLLGKCVPRHGSLPPPVFNQSDLYQSAGTHIGLQKPANINTEGGWLTTIRYTVGQGVAPTAPDCLSSAQYDESGLDLIRRAKTVIIRAILCHPLHYDSTIAEMTFTGNSHMDPPMCNVSGTKSTETTYALSLDVSLVVENTPDAKIFYEFNGSSGVLYTEPLTVDKAGLTTIRAVASKLGYDESMPKECNLLVDGPARVMTQLSWLDGSQPGGFVYETGAFLVSRSTQELRFQFIPGVPAGVPLSQPVQINYRL